MARDKHQVDPTENKEMGSAGRETGIDEPSELGSAGIYATRIHEEGEEALEAGERRAADEQQANDSTT